MEIGNHKAGLSLKDIDKKLKDENITPELRKALERKKDIISNDKEVKK